MDSQEEVKRMVDDERYDDALVRGGSQRLREAEDQRDFLEGYELFCVSQPESALDRAPLTLSLSAG